MAAGGGFLIDYGIERLIEPAWRGQAGWLLNARSALPGKRETVADWEHGKVNALVTVQLLIESVQCAGVGIIAFVRAGNLSVP